MKIQVRRFGILQTAKVLGVMYFIAGMFFFIPIGLIGLVSGKAEGMSPFLMLFVPFVYGFFAFLAIAASCALYNFLTPYVGGIEFES